MSKTDKKGIIAPLTQTRNSVAQCIFYGVNGTKQRQNLQIAVLTRFYENFRFLKFLAQNQGDR
jgi:hypothetical protein